MSEDKPKKKIRNVGITFPRTDAGNFVHEALKVNGEDEDRSLSKIAYRIIRAYYDATSDEFKEMVNKRIAERNATSEEGEEDFTLG